MIPNNPFVEFARRVFPDITLDWFQIEALDLAYRCWVLHDPEVPNVMFWWPSGYGKSWLIQLIGACILALDPTRKIQLGANSDDLAKEDASGIFEILNSALFAQHYYTPEFVSEPVANFKLKQGGGLHAASIGGQQYGWRADIYLLDDPTRSIDDAWSQGAAKKLRKRYQAGVTTRLTPAAPIIVTAQRLKVDDLPGWLREQAYQNRRKKQWAIYCLPQVPNEQQYPFLEYTRRKWEGREPQDKLELYKTLASIKGTRFSFDEEQSQERLETANDSPVIKNAMLQQYPGEDDELIWPDKNWGIIDRISPTDIEYINIGIDSAVKIADTNDYSCWCVVVYGPRFGYVVVDYIETRVRFPQLVSLTVALWDRVRGMYGVEPRLSVERAGSGEQLCNWLEDKYPAIKFFEPDSDALSKKKYLRAASVSSFTDVGSVSILGSMPAEKRQHFIDTLMNFGNPSWHDDLCDSYVWAMLPFIGKRGFRKKENLETQQELRALARWQEVEEIADEIEYQKFMSQWDWADF